MSQFTVVTVGLPDVARALEETKQFEQVVGVDSTGGLRDLLQSKQLKPGAKDKIFFFSSSATVDTEQTLEFLIQRMIALNARVVVVATDVRARGLVDACPGAGLLEGNLYVNTVLGAVNGMGVSVEPHHDNYLIGQKPPQPETVIADPLPSSNPFAATKQPEASNPFETQAAQPTPVVEPVQENPNPFGAINNNNNNNPFGGAETNPPTANQASPNSNPFAQNNEPNPFDAPPAPVSEQKPSQMPGQNPFANQPVADDNPFNQKPVNNNPFGENTNNDPFGASPQQNNGFAEQTASQMPSQNPFANQPEGFANPAQNFQQVQPATNNNPFGGSNQTAGFGQNSGFGQNAQQPEQNNNMGGFGPVSRPGAMSMAKPEGGRRGFVITVTAPKGGTGKSSLSLNLAAYLGLRLQNSGKTVCLIDANVQQADAGKYLNQFTPNVEDVLRDPSSIHVERIQNYLLHKPELNMSALLGPMTVDSAHPAFYTGEKYSQILEALRPSFDYIIIDTPVAEFYHDLFREFAIPQADFICVPIAPNYATLMDAEGWLNQICAPKQGGGMGVNPAKVGIVLNRAEDGIGMDEEEVIRELSSWNYIGAIPETKEWKRCNNQGLLVATKNYQELNDAFSNVLFKATNEEMLRTTTGSNVGSGNGWKEKLVNVLKKFA